MYLKDNRAFWGYLGNRSSPPLLDLLTVFQVHLGEPYQILEEINETSFRGINETSQFWQNGVRFPGNVV